MFSIYDFLELNKSAYQQNEGWKVCQEICRSQAAKNCCQDKEELRFYKSVYYEFVSVCVFECLIHL